jgi:hypothetical protein
MIRFLILLSILSPFLLLYYALKRAEDIAAGGIMEEGDRILSPPFGIVLARALSFLGI